MMEARLPPGFRFHPRDDELVLDYLSRKLSGGGGGAYGGIAMVDVDLNKREPWELPGTCLAQLAATTSVAPLYKKSRTICILSRTKMNHLHLVQKEISRHSSCMKIPCRLA
jgi:hypothetical protein